MTYRMQFGARLFEYPVLSPKAAGAFQDCAWEVGPSYSGFVKRDEFAVVSPAGVEGVVCGAEHPAAFAPLGGQGYCYVALLRPEFAEMVARHLGPWPAVAALLGLPAVAFDSSALDHLRALQVPGGWHLCEHGFMDARLFLSVAARESEEIWAAGSLGEAVGTLSEFPKQTVCASAPVGGCVVDAPDLLRLYQQDFSSCKCRVHEVPLTKDKAVAGLGCVQKPAGRAGVFANAFSGKPGVCHADEGTRVQDYKMLGLWLSSVDPGTLDGSPRPVELQALCTSSRDTELAAFGNGYCYLAAIHPDAWWRTARLLGPNPRLDSLARALVWVGKGACRPHVFQEVSPGLYHLAVDKSARGLVRSAGRDLVALCLRILAVEPVARVGAGDVRAASRVDHDLVPPLFRGSWFPRVPSAPSTLTGSPKQLCYELSGEYPVLPNDSRLPRAAKLSSAAMAGWLHYLTPVGCGGEIDVRIVLDSAHSLGVWVLTDKMMRDIDMVRVHDVVFGSEVQGAVCVRFKGEVRAVVRTDRLASLACYVYVG